MARFVVYRGRRSEQLFVDCQSSLLSHLKNRFVIPLLSTRTFEGRISVLNPVFVLGGEEMVLGTHYAFTIPLADLGDVVTSLEDEEYAIVRAMDTLTGTA